MSTSCIVRRSSTQIERNRTSIWNSVQLTPRQQAASCTGLRCPSARLIQLRWRSALERLAPRATSMASKLSATLYGTLFFAVASSARRSLIGFLALPGGHGNGPWMMADLENGSTGWEEQPRPDVSTNAPLRPRSSRPYSLATQRRRTGGKGRFAAYAATLRAAASRLCTAARALPKTATSRCASGTLRHATSSVDARSSPADAAGRSQCRP